jgi:hypothetical protein
MAESPLRVLALVTDAFGGHGGIAQFNRDLILACGMRSDQRCGRPAPSGVQPRRACPSGCVSFILCKAGWHIRSPPFGQQEHIGPLTLFSVGICSWFH